MELSSALSNNIKTLKKPIDFFFKAEHELFNLELSEVFLDFHHSSEMQLTLLMSSSICGLDSWRLRPIKKFSFL